MTGMTNTGPSTLDMLDVLTAENEHLTALLRVPPAVLGWAENTVAFGETWPNQPLPPLLEREAAHWVIAVALADDD